MLLEPLDCGDNSCWFALEITGQRTNGGCRCLKSLPEQFRHQIHIAFQQHKKAEREQCARLVEQSGLIDTPYNEQLAAQIRKGR